MPNRDYKSVSLQSATVDRLQLTAVRLSAEDQRRLTLSEVVDRLIGNMYPDITEPPIVPEAQGPANDYTV